MEFQDKISIFILIYIYIYCNLIGLSVQVSSCDTQLGGIF